MAKKKTAKKKTAKKKQATTKKSAAQKPASKAKAARATTAKKKVAKKKVAKKKAVKKSGAARKTSKKKTAAQKTAKKSAKKTVTKKAATKKKAAAKKSAAKKSAAKKVATKKTVKRAASKAVATKNTAKSTAKKATATNKPPAPNKPLARTDSPRKSGSPAKANKSPFFTPASRDERPLDISPAAKPCQTSAEAGLNARDLEQFRLLLQEKRAELRGDVSALKNQAFGSSEQVGDESRMPLHMADLGSDNFEHELTLALVEGEQVILREIEEALERIDKRTYGICLATGRPVGKKRLTAKPWAKYCYEYTLAQERGRR